MHEVYVQEQMMTACLANKLSVSVVGKTLWPVVYVTQDIFLKF